MLQLKAGDVVCTRNPMWLGRAITAAEKFWSTDCEAKYSHALVMLNATNTFEALWTNRSQDFFRAYAGENVLIARPIAPADLQIQIALNKIYHDHAGKMYPFWRLFAFLLPPLAKINFSDRPVCSEMVAEYLQLVSVRPHPWKGVNPDTLADEFRDGRAYEVIFEGRLEPNWPRK